MSSEQKFRLIALTFHFNLESICTCIIMEIISTAVKCKVLYELRFSQARSQHWLNLLVQEEVQDWAFYELKGNLRLCLSLWVSQRPSKRHSFICMSLHFDLFFFSSLNNFGCRCKNVAATKLILNVDRLFFAFHKQTFCYWSYSSKLFIFLFPFSAWMNIQPIHRWRGIALR